MFTDQILILATFSSQQCFSVLIAAVLKVLWLKWLINQRPAGPAELFITPHVSAEAKRKTLIRKTLRSQQLFIIHNQMFSLQDCTPNASKNKSVFRAEICWVFTVHYVQVCYVACCVFAGDLPSFPQTDSGGSLPPWQTRMPRHRAHVGGPHRPAQDRLQHVHEGQTSLRYTHANLCHYSCGGNNETLTTERLTKTWF